MGNYETLLEDLKELLGQRAICQQSGHITINDHLVICTYDNDHDAGIAWDVIGAMQERIRSAIRRIKKG